MPILDALAKDAQNAVPGPQQTADASDAAPDSVPAPGANGDVMTFDDLMGKGETADELYTRTLKERDDADVLDYLKHQADQIGVPLDLGSETDRLWQKAEQTSKMAAQNSSLSPLSMASHFAAPALNWATGGGTGLLEDVPSIALGGVAKGLQNTMNFPGAATNFAADWLNNHGYALPGGLQITDPKTGNYDLKWLNSDEWQKFQEAGGKSEVPEAHLPLSGMKPDTPAGQLLQSMLQFMVGLGVVSKFTGGMGQGYSFGGLTKRLGQYSLADLVSWDGQEGNLANLIQSFPALKNPVTQFLATDKDTPEMEGRFRNALAGLPFNVVTEPLLWWIKGIKATRTIKALTNSQSLDEAFKKLGVDNLSDAGKKIAEMKASGGHYPTRLPQGGQEGRPPPVPAERTAPPVPPSASDAIVGNPEDDLIHMGDNSLMHRDTLTRQVADGMGDKSLTPQALAGKGASQAAVAEGPAKAVTPPPIPEGLQQVQGIRLFHASPYDFEKFDASKIGTGEGAQSYGYGHYAAESQSLSGVQGHYYKQFLDSHGTAHSYELRINAKPEQFLDWDKPLSEQSEAVQKAIRGLVAQDRGAAGSVEKLRPAAAKLADEIRTRLGNKPFETASERGHETGSVEGMLYVVRLHGTPDQKAAANSLFAQLKQIRPAGPDLSHLSEIDTSTGKELLMRFTRDNLPADAQRLRDAGIPGIRYKDAMSRGAEGEGTYNYVVFPGNEDLIEVVAKDGKPIKGQELADVIAKIKEQANATPQEGGAAPPGQPPSGGPPALHPEGQPPARQPRFSDRVNWSKIETDADMQEAARRMIDENQSMLEAQGYGTRVSWDQTEEAAKAMPVIDMLVNRGRHAGKTLDAAQMRAAGQIFTQAMADLERTARIAASPNHTAQDLINLEHMQRIFTMAQNLYLPATSEVARSLNILKKVQSELGGNYRQQVDLMLDRMGGADTMEAKAAALVDIFDHVHDPESLIKASRGISAATTGAAVREYWINSIFSIRTLLRNLIGNTVTTTLAIPERKLMEGLGQLDPVQGAAPGEARELLKGYIAAQGEALSVFWRAFKAGGETPANMLEDVGGPALSRLKLETHPYAFSAKGFNMEDNLWARAVDVLGTILTQGRWKTRLMGSTDAYFKVILARGQQYALALREATHEMERGVIQPAQLNERWAHYMANPTKQMMAEIADFAAEGTFTREPSDTVRGIQKMISGPKLPVVGRPLQFIVPFIPTPANLFKYAAERSPAWAISQTFRADIAAGGVRRDSALAKMAIGSALIAIAYQMGLKGIITPSGKFGGTDSIIGKRQLEQRRGHLEYALRIPWTQKPDGTWTTRDFSLNGMAPATFWLGLGADLAAYAKNAEPQSGDRDFLESWSTAVFSLAATQLDQSFFFGAAQFLDAVNEPERYGEYTLQNMVTSFIPAEVRDAARATDPTLRQAHDLTTALLNKLPEYNKQLPPRLDLYGREVKGASGFGWGYDVVSPSYSKGSDKNQPIDEELAKLEYYPVDSVRITLTGTQDPSAQVLRLRNLPEIQYEFKKFAGQTPADKILDTPMVGQDGEQADLRDLMMQHKGSVYRSYVRLLDNLGNKTMLEALNGLVTGKLGEKSRDYLDTDVEGKKAMIRDIISAFRAASRVKIVAEHPELQALRDRMYRKGEGYVPQFNADQVDRYEQQSPGAP